MKGAWVEQVGCGIMGALVCGALTVIGGTLVADACSRGRNADEAGALEPLSAAELAAAAPGRRVLVVGRIDPSSAVIEPQRGLVMYLRERCEMSYGRKGRKSYTWKLAERALPEFQLQMGEAAVPVLAGTYGFRRPSVQDPHDSEAGAVAYEGFKAGDRVVVDGRMSEGSLRADLVFGGDHQAYLAELRGDAPTSLTHGSVALGLAAVLAALAVWYIRRCGRKARQAAPAPARA
jgi:hypothetical protein